MSGNYATITPQVKDYLDGLLLGDGSIVKSGKIAALYILNQRSEHYDWIEKQISFFSENGIKCNTYMRPASDFELNGRKYRRKEQIRLHTITYRNFLDQRIRWYPLGKKIVPKDLNFENPKLLANWYMGDGSVVRDKNILIIRFSTEGFSLDDVEFLSSKFQEIGIDTKINFARKKPVLYIKYWHASKFLNLVKNYIVPSFNYKAPIDLWKLPKCQICDIEMNTRSFAKYCHEHVKIGKRNQDKKYYQMRKNIKLQYEKE